MSAYQIKAVFFDEWQFALFQRVLLITAQLEGKTTFPSLLEVVFGYHQLRFAMLGIKHRQENNSARAGNMIMLNRFIACNIFSPCLGY